MKRRLSALLLACAAIVAGAFGELAVAGGGIASDDKTGYRVWQYFDVSYSEQTCGDSVGYRINTYYARWYREVKRRRISSARLHAGQILTQSCSERLQEQRTYETDVNPRFETPHRTRQYYHSFDWPYSFEASPGNSRVGINMKGVIRNRAGDFLGSLCSKVYLMGQGDCP